MTVAKARRGHPCLVVRCPWVLRRILFSSTRTNLAVIKSSSVASMSPSDLFYLFDFSPKKSLILIPPAVPCTCTAASPATAEGLHSLVAHSTPLTTTSRFLEDLSPMKFRCPGWICLNQFYSITWLNLFKPRLKLWLNRFFNFYLRGRR